MSIDTDHRLPKRLVKRAIAEHERNGMIGVDTAALLIEAGIHPADLDNWVFEHTNTMEAA